MLQTKSKFSSNLVGGIIDASRCSNICNLQYKRNNYITCNLHTVNVMSLNTCDLQYKHNDNDIHNIAYGTSGKPFRATSRCVNICNLQHKHICYNFAHAISVPTKRPLGPDLQTWALNASRNLHVTFTGETKKNRTHSGAPVQIPSCLTLEM